MKKSFSLMEVIIATALLSTALLALIQSGNNSLNFIEKSEKTKKEKEYLQIALDTKPFSNRNENIYLDKEFSNLDDDLRLELKKIKIKVKEELLSKEDIKLDNFSFTLNKTKTEYIVDEKVKKNIYKIKISF